MISFGLLVLVCLRFDHLPSCGLSVTAEMAATQTKI